jgi:hypothetical protein
MRELGQVILTAVRIFGKVMAVVLAISTIVIAAVASAMGMREVK